MIPPGHPRLPHNRPPFLPGASFLACPPAPVSQGPHKSHILLEIYPDGQPGPLPSSSERPLSPRGHTLMPHLAPEAPPGARAEPTLLCLGGQLHEGRDCLRRTPIPGVWGVWGYVGRRAGHAFDRSLELALFPRAPVIALPRCPCFLLRQLMTSVSGTRSCFSPTLSSGVGARPGSGRPRDVPPPCCELLETSEDPALESCPRRVGGVQKGVWPWENRKELGRHLPGH